ncbi:hypothetical protein [Spiroplasma endosymbiont of Atherix ibis]|uniref:hypothetical protein n=1 Tax=Spiroplasma endosymbiont of Atherix ibis TaxID=3066291 RepID=UPI0030CD4D39
MDIMNSQFIYSIDSENPTSKNNKALDINYNLSFFSESNLSGYNQKTFLTETFEDKTVQEKFLNMITDSDYWKDIFGYEYDPEKDLSTWEPYRSVNYWSDATSFTYLKKTAANHAGKISNFYIYIIEKLK